MSLGQVHTVAACPFKVQWPKRWLDSLPAQIIQQPQNKNQGHIMNLSLSIGPVVSLIAGVLILLMPRLLNFIVAIYLIVIGLVGLFGLGSLRL
jgi:hypothetical protein